MAEIIPELVSEDENGYKSVAYSRATAIIATAVKELREEFVNEIKNMKLEMDMMKQDLSEIKKSLKVSAREKFSKFYG